MRDLLRDALGRDSFVAQFISSVRPEERRTPTASIDVDGHLQYNPEFMRRYVQSRCDVFSLVFHELLHPLFNHYMYGHDWLTNVACDAVINAVISCVYRERSQEGVLFSRYYPPRGESMLLRPDARTQGTRLHHLYRNLYGPSPLGPRRASTGEVIQALQVLMPAEKAAGIALIGSHSPADPTTSSPSETAPQLPAQVSARFAAELRQSLERSNGAGQYPELFDVFSQVLTTHLGLRRQLLEEFVTKNRIDKFRGVGRGRRCSVSPVPVSPSKRDCVLLAAGLWPGYFRNTLPGRTFEKMGIAVFLDVSGSVDDFLPKILGVLKNMRSDIGKVFQFSNEVVQTDLDALTRQGRVRTTYGTDFGCVATTILENQFDRAVVITDGLASLQDENEAKLRKRGVAVLTILFGYGTSCTSLEPLGPVISLDEAAECV